MHTFKWVDIKFGFERDDWGSYLNFIFSIDVTLNLSRLVEQMVLMNVHLTECHKNKPSTEEPFWEVKIFHFHKFIYNT